MNISNSNSATSSHTQIEARLGAEFRRFRILGMTFYARAKVGGVLINPRLPKDFDNTSNDWRPASHQKWWGLPYIETMSVEDWDHYYAERTDEWAKEGRELWAERRHEWLAAWPSGTRFDVRCLDGGAWDRSTCWGMFATLSEAIECASSGPAWRK
jgi:hypothetical protein